MGRLQCRGRASMARPDGCYYGFDSLEWSHMAARKKPLGRSRANEADRHVAARVRSRRLQLGLSQTDLGKGIGVTFQQVQKYENGKNRIGSGRLHQIGAILGVDPSYFFNDPLSEMDGAAAGMKADLFDRFCASKEGTALMQAFVKIKSKSVQRAIAELVRCLND